MLFQTDVTILNRVKKNFFRVQSVTSSLEKRCVGHKVLSQFCHSFVTNVTTPRDFRYLVDPDSRLDSGLETTLSAIICRTAGGVLLQVLEFLQHSVCTVLFTVYLLHDMVFTKSEGAQTAPR